MAGGEAPTSVPFEVRCPKEVRDYDPFQTAVREKVINSITKSFKCHGAENISTPLFELREMLVKSGKYAKDFKFLYNLGWEEEEFLSLRCDLRIPFARYLVNNDIKQFKRYHIAQVYQKTVEGNPKEVYQCDFDIVGDYDAMIPDAECLKLVVEILSNLQLGDFVIIVNHCKLLQSIFAVCGATSDEHSVLILLLDKLNKLPWEDVKKEMIDSGLTDDVASLIGTYIEQNDGKKMIETLESDTTLMSIEDAKIAVEEMKILFQYCTAFGIENKLLFNLSYAHPFLHSTGLVFKAISKDDHSKPLLYGGRYDDLVMTINPNGGKVPCVGFSVDIERIFSIMEVMEGTLSKVREVSTDVMVASAENNMIEEKMQVCNLMWKAGIPAEMAYKKDFMEYCEDKGVSLVVIVGGREKERGGVKLIKVPTKDEMFVYLNDLEQEVKAKLQNFHT